MEATGGYRPLARGSNVARVNENPCETTRTPKKIVARQVLKRNASCPFTYTAFSEVTLISFNAQDFARYRRSPPPPRRSTHTTISPAIHPQHMRVPEPACSAPPGLTAREHGPRRCNGDVMDALDEYRQARPGTCCHPTAASCLQ